MIKVAVFAVLLVLSGCTGTHAGHGDGQRSSSHQH